MSKPLINMTRFRRYHVKLNEKLLKLSMTDIGHLKLSPRATENLKYRAMERLPASNLLSRMVVVQELVAAFRRHHPRAGLFWITIVPDGFLIPLIEHELPDVEGMKAWVSEVLDGLNYVAAIDLAAYREAWQPMHSDKVVSTHVHLLVWGRSASEIKALIKTINREEAAFRPGLRPGHQMAVSPQEAIEKLFYAAKFPMKEYRLRQRVRPGNRPGTWEKVGRFKQEKEDIRPGIAARVATKLACFTMHEILFGGGTGVGIVSIALKNAERRIKIEQQEAFARRFRLAFGRQPQ